MPFKLGHKPDGSWKGQNCFILDIRLSRGPSKKMELFLCCQKIHRQIRDSPSTRAMHSNLGLKIGEREVKRELGIMSKATRKKE